MPLHCNFPLKKVFHIYFDGWWEQRKGTIDAKVANMDTTFTDESRDVKKFSITIPIFFPIACEILLPNTHQMSL